MRFRLRKGTADAQKALDDAQENLDKVQQRSHEVNKVANALKDMRERNHFAEQLEEIIARRRGSFQ